MAKPEHLAILQQGAKIWNAWRQENPIETPDLTQADLSNADLALADLIDAELEGANFRGACLEEANLDGAWLVGACLSYADITAGNFRNTNLTKANLLRVYGEDARFGNADLSRASLERAYLWMADFEGAHLVEANLKEANLDRANLERANLTGADLTRATLTGTNLKAAVLHQTRIYGVSAWDVVLDSRTDQRELRILAPGSEERITVDNIEIAQFLNLILNNQRIRDVIDTLTSKVVLILGRFTPDRKAVLQALREELRNRNYTPVLFDFEKPVSRDLTETVATLAHMARFVIADITDAKSIPQELERIVPDLPSVPVQPLLLASQHEYGMFEHFRRYSWVLEPVLYEDQNILLAELEERIIAPSEAKVKEQTGR
jgi:uncharacterized protein YjbI with pentapeptide repeats